MSGPDERSSKSRRATCRLGDFQRGRSGALVTHPGPLPVGRSECREVRLLFLDLCSLRSRGREFASWMSRLLLSLEFVDQLVNCLSQDWNCQVKLLTQALAAK